MTDKEIMLAFINILPIIIIWVRLESRLSRLEGKFSMICIMMQNIITDLTKRHGA